MSDESLSATSSLEAEDETDSSDESVSSSRALSCVPVPLEAHIKAYIDNENIEREVEAVTCNSEVVDKVVSNYIIVKKILSNLPWPDKVLCKQVCSTWRSAIQTLQKEQLGPIDFMLSLYNMRKQGSLLVLKRSGIFCTEPMIVMTFVSKSGLDITCQCASIEPCPCGKPCLSNHHSLDLLQKYTSGPKSCMKIVRTEYLEYMPLSNSVTFEHTFTYLTLNPYMVGVFIPVIPDVKVHTVNIKSIDYMQQEFCDFIHELVKDRIFKGILVYVTDKTYLTDSIEYITFLNHFKELQPDIPYALGGCIIEDAFDQSNIKEVINDIKHEREFVSENIVSITMFTVPRNPPSNEFNFDMFSLVLDKSYWTKQKIQQGINEFSKRVPQFEYSVAIKLACIGRDKKHKWEQDCFRAVFPNTRIVGCYGNGELGLDHPQKPSQELAHSSAKRHCGQDGQQTGCSANSQTYIHYMYSTVFVYIGWGKILSYPS